jgi:hypothetical protein
MTPRTAVTRMRDPFADPAQMTRLRTLLAVPDGAPDPTGEDVLAVLEAQSVIEAEERAWLALDPEEEQ